MTPWEAARLAAVLPNPIKYNPLKASSFVEKRANLIYSIMKRRGIIKEEYEYIESDTDRHSKEETPEREEKTLEGSPQTPVPEAKSPDSS